MASYANTSSCGVVEGTTSIAEVLLTLLTIAMIVGYFVYFVKYQEQSVFGLGQCKRQQWVDWMLEKEKTCILAVQTMRNELMVGTFLGETSFNAVTVIISIFTALDLTCTLRALESYDPLLGSAGSLLSPASKVGLICFLLAAIFATSMQSVRFTKHISVMGASFSSPVCDPMHAEMKAAMLHMYNRSSVFLFVAQRLVYLVFAAVSWLLGPTFFCLTTLACVLHMASVDSSSAMDAQRMKAESLERRDGREQRGTHPLLHDDAVAILNNSWPAATDASRPEVVPRAP